MCSADYGMDGAVVGQSLYVLQGVDNTRMSASEQDDGAAGGFEVHGLIIGDEVALPAFPVDEKRPGVLLEIGHARNLPGGKQASENASRVLGTDVAA